MAEPLKVGVTGSLGAGKSTLCRMLAQRGFPVIDADRTAREVAAPGSPVVAELAAAFGADLVGAGGRLDRARLAERAFASPAARDRLQAIVHPVIRRALAAAVARLGAEGQAVVVIEAAMILEGGHRDFYDLLVVVTAPEAVKLERAGARGLERADARRRLALQWDDGRKAAAADWVVPNDGGLEALEAEVERLARALRAPRGPVPGARRDR